MRSRLLATLLFGCSLLLGSSNAYAVPLLQLDIAGGVYDETSETIIATSNPFTLYALATPQGNYTAESILSYTFSVSMAVIAVDGSAVVPPGADLGSFTVNGVPVDVTEGMVYGTPPVEVFSALQGSDAGDLAKHGVYPTYFTEFDFQFSAGSTTPTYDTATGESSPGSSFLQAFTIDTSLLNPNYVIHFDLYNTSIRSCTGQMTSVIGAGCVDVDVTKFAPFSHDAQSPPVPEPATILLLSSGVVAGMVRRRMRKGREQTV